MSTLDELHELIEIAGEITGINESAEMRISRLLARLEELVARLEEKEEGDAYDHYIRNH